MSESGVGGIKEVIAIIAGNNVYSRLKYESGVHRVQRVPATEASGRIHTSTATVAVLPEAEDIDIQISEKDLRIDRSEEHTSELQSQSNLVCRLLLEKKKKTNKDEKLNR